MAYMLLGLDQNLLAGPENQTRKKLVQRRLEKVAQEHLGSMSWINDNRSLARIELPSASMAHLLNLCLDKYTSSKRKLRAYITGAQLVNP